MADDVVERLLRDPVERLLDLERETFIELDLAGRSRSPTRPSTAATCVRSAFSRPSRSIDPGRSSKMSERISASASRWSSRSSAKLRLGRLGVAGQLQLDAAADERHREERLGHRVVQLAGEVRPLGRGGELGRLAAQVALESLALGQVARRPRALRRARRSRNMPVAKFSTGTVDAIVMPRGRSARR